jgi:hypothetical protein
VLPSPKFQKKEVAPCVQLLKVTLCPTYTVSGTAETQVAVIRDNGDGDDFLHPLIKNEMPMIYRSMAKGVIYVFIALK